MQAVLQDGMESDVQKQWVERSVLAVDAAFPFPDYSNWPDCERLLAHAQVASALIARYEMRSLECAGMLSRAALYLKQRAKYAESEVFQRQALQIYEKPAGRR